MDTARSFADSGCLPVHVAIIMDGNGRWARLRDLPRIAGHREGAKAVRRTIRASGELGIRYLTLYGFSLENWKRPATEVAALMSLLRLYLREEVAKLDAEGVRLRFIGERRQLDPDIVTLIEMAERRTSGNTTLDVTVALSYGGRQEITAAIRRVAEDAVAGRLKPAAIDERTVAARLFTSGIPDPDLLIRTSGEQRISNFLLWQAAYAEMVFTDVLWPDFTREDLERSITEFQRRERRYGAISA